MIERADSTFGAAPPVEPAAPAADATAGQLLRAARTAAGLHIAALAAALKVPVAKLDALEADRHDLLPDPVFARALAGSVCRNLKIDPEPVLQRLPHAGHRLARDDAGLNAPFRRAATVSQPVRDTMARPVLWAVAALLLGAAALYLVPQWSSLWQRLRPAPSLVSGDADSPVSVSEPAAPAVAAASVTASAVAPTPGATAPAQAPVPVPVPVPAPPAEAASAPQTMPAGPLLFRARGTSWIQVTDARRAVVLERTLQAGDAVAAEGVHLPLSVVVGRADVTEVSVRGNRFDLTPHLRDNVARFEVR